MLSLALLLALADPAPCAEVPGMACVHAGAFLRGTNDGLHPSDANARPQASVWLQTYWMDLHEVTVEDYRACVAAGACKKAGPSYPDFDAPRQPITGVNWFHARDYCAWRGKRLPTEAQWEKAARGTDGRTFPWGEEPATCARAVYMDAKGRSCGVPMATPRKHLQPKGRPEPVGTRPPNAYGLFDMAGNSWEWVADWYAPSYAACGAACTGEDPKGPCDGAATCKRFPKKLVRGGSWYWPAARMTTYHRRAQAPENKPFHHYGFRCAATVDDVAALTRR